MPSTSQNQLYEQFVSVATDFVAISGGITGIIAGLTGQNTSTSSSSSSTASSGGGGVLDTIGSVAKDLSENALGAVPLIRGIIGLFSGGDDSPAPPAFPKYLLPPAIQFDAADTPDGLANVDYSQSSTPRAFGGNNSTSSPTAPQQITVNVQAMDARSFLDRSTDIAAAVREAILNSSSLNDVVSEL